MHWAHNEDEVDSFPHPNTCTRQLAISLGLFPFEVPSLHFRVLFFCSPCCSAPNILLSNPSTVWKLVGGPDISKVYLWECQSTTLCIKLCTFLTHLQCISEALLHTLMHCILDSTCYATLHCPLHPHLHTCRLHLFVCLFTFVTSACVACFVCLFPLLDWFH